MAVSFLGRRLGQQFLSWALMGLLLCWGITSCGSTGRSSGGANAGEVEFWTMQLQPKYTDYFNTLIADFEQENPDLKIKWVDVPWSAMESKILTAVSANTAPDVVNLNPGFASQLASKDAWLNLNNVVPTETKAEYLPKIWQASSLGNVSFGLPWYLTTRVAIYNQDLLAQAGVEKPPSTYAELAQVAQKVKDKTGKYAFFVTVVPEDSAEILESMVQMGVTLVDAEGKAAFNSPEGKAAFQYWVDLFQKKLLPQEILTQGHSRAVELYQAGETAVLSSGAEFLSSIATNAPQVSTASAAAAQITGDTGKKNVAVMNLVIPKGTDNPDGALKFALFVTNSENQLTFAQAANVLPSTQQSLTEYQAGLKQLGEKASAVEQARAVSAGQMQDAEVLVPAMKDLKQLQKAIYENLQAAMLGEKTVDEALTAAETAWNG
ncbi:MAG: sugar ABC transporter substrate-binding protein [Synechococcales cyanobacterium RU_4_20]|nr:sugar ABC transporter substrate-binding protein [Synechococcales cyanobacterium RU_4_20]NJR70079.1 sugar ABC transporter substrate-binding protein [Synechococcales cyanobacterium CRU_2_2]